MYFPLVLISINSKSVGNINTHVNQQNSLSKLEFVYNVSLMSIVSIQIIYDTSKVLSSNAFKITNKWGVYHKQ